MQKRANAATFFASISVEPYLFQLDSFRLNRTLVSKEPLDAVILVQSLFRFSHSNDARVS